MILVRSIKKISRNVLGLEKAVIITLVARAWTVVGGIGSLYFITRYITPTMQGYYYTFGSLITLQLFVELGLTYAIVQFSSHEMAELTWKSNGTVTGSRQAKKRLQSILKFAVTWFTIGAILMVSTLIPIGLQFFEKTIAEQDYPITTLATPWALLVCATGINLIVAAFVAIVEGCGKVVEVATLRLFQSIISVCTVWLVLYLGGNIYALAASSAIACVIGGGILFLRHGRFFLDLIFYKGKGPGVNWRHEIWPFQWRIALSWASGFLIFNLFNPILLVYHGPLVAGKMGMSLQIIAALNNAALAWITTKIPTFGQLLAKKQFVTLNNIFFKAVRQSTIFLFLAIVFVMATIIYLTSIESHLPTRLLSIPLLICLGIVCLANHLVFSEAAYLRANKEEPFMLISLCNGLVTALLAIFLVPRYAAIGAVISYATGAIVISLVWGTFVFKRKIKEHLNIN